jgi:hypothetical protein
MGQHAKLAAIESMQLARWKSLHLWNLAQQNREEMRKTGRTIIINVDETWFTAENRDKQTIHHTNTSKQPSQVNNKPSSDRQLAFSIMCAACLEKSEEGEEIKAKYIHPAFVFQGEPHKINDNKAREDKNAFIRFNKTHYFNTVLILEWLDWLLNKALKVDREQDTVFMWWDAAPCHTSEEVMTKLQELQEAGVLYVQFIPRNTTMLFQV